MPTNVATTESYATDLTFADLSVDARLVAVLEGQGITTAFPIQALTIGDALAGRDVCGKAKTGSGKTLGFGLPVLQRLAASPAIAGTRPTRPRGLVLVPTRELAIQVRDVLAPLGQAIGVRVGPLYGGADIERQIARLHGGVDLVIATPGRLIDLGDRGEVALDRIAELVIDEADRMADMGFMPQVEWVLRHIGRHAHQTLLFSATLDGAVDRLVKRYLHEPVFHEVASDTVTVSAMVHHFLQVHQLDRIKVVASIVRPLDKVIVFVRTKRGADRLVEQLAKERVIAGAIHGDLRQAQRERTLADFSSNQLAVLVATDVAARGLDIDGVDCVIHFDPPEDEKAYLHRSGRTARAGSTGVVVSLLLWNQVLGAEILMKRLALKQPVVEVFSNNPQLAHLDTWDPTATAASA